MKTNETTKPLYQRLNEERTQGEIKTEQSQMYQNVIQLLQGYDTFGQICPLNGGNPTTKEQNTANAQYTALSVNTLHHLAEALYQINCMCADAKSKDDINIGKIAKLSKEALNRIS